MGRREGSVTLFSEVDSKLGLMTTASVVAMYPGWLSVASKGKV